MMISRKSFPKKKIVDLVEILLLNGFLGLGLVWEDGGMGVDGGWMDGGMVGCFF